MIKTMKNFETGNVDDVAIENLTDDDATMYIPMGTIPQNRAILQAVYDIYRGNGRSPYEAVVDTLLSILSGKTEDSFGRQS